MINSKYLPDRTKSRIQVIISIQFLLTGKFKEDVITNRDNWHNGTIPYNSGPNNNIQINSGQIIVITFHIEYKVIVKRNHSDLNNGELKKHIVNFIFVVKLFRKKILVELLSLGQIDRSGLRFIELYRNVVICELKKNKNLLSLL